jgi:hypothetical protein
LVLGAAKTALRLGKVHALTTVKELRVLGDCLVAYGGQFPTAFPDAQRILNGSPAQRWQMGVWLREWFDTSLNRSALPIKVMS